MGFFSLLRKATRQSGLAEPMGSTACLLLFLTFDFGFAHEAEGVETMRWRSDRQAASLEWL
jgi:hypothetical protein